MTTLWGATRAPRQDGDLSVLSPMHPYKVVVRGSPTLCCKGLVVMEIFCGAMGYRQHPPLTPPEEGNRLLLPSTGGAGGGFFWPAGRHQDPYSTGSETFAEQLL